jgi:putative endonuclease
MHGLLKQKKQNSLVFFTWINYQQRGALCLNEVAKQPMGGYVYITCNVNNTTLYVGVTAELGKRIRRHREKFYPKSFSARYNCCKLVYYKFFPTIVEAIAEEKRIKGGSRKKKEILINSMNPEWVDLYEQVKFL